MHLAAKAAIGAAALTTVFLATGTNTSSANDAVPATALNVGFGAAVAVGDGEVFVAEASTALSSFRPGMVYVYRKTGNAWRHAVSLVGPNSAVHDQFGTSLAVDGNRMFVGSGPTMLHVFAKQGTTWSYSGTVRAAETGRENAQFGGAVASSGDWLLIGRTVALAGGGGRGRGGGRGGAAPAVPAGEVYAFRRNAAGQYAYQATLSSPDSGSAGDGFGASLAIEGGVALVGAIGTDGGAGLVHEFAVNSAGTWERRRAFGPIGLSSGDRFGASMTMASGNAYVSAPGDGGGYGVVYALTKAPQGGGRGGFGGGGGGGRGRGGVPDSTWAEQARLASPSGVRGEGFGVALAADAREAFVSAPGAATSGGVFVFTRDSTGFQRASVRFLAPPASDPPAILGTGVAMAVRGNVLAVGATVNNRNTEGLLIFEREANGNWRQMPVIKPPLDEIAAVTGAEQRCSEEGKVDVFDCSSAELQAFIPPSRMTHDGHYIEMNDIWGWKDSVTGKEWALVGRRDGTTFVDISDPSNPVPVADLPLTDGARPASWRDMKVYKNHTYIVSDGSGPHGMQIFDLTRLRTLRPQANGRPVMVRPDTTYREVNSVHNIVINEESGFAYAVGASAGGTTCGGGLHMIDIREPKNAKFAGCFADTTTGRSGTGYSHDAQCVMYTRGPDARYRGREICIGSNENSISIADVTDKQNPKAISRAAYPNFGYTHQGWFNEDQRYFFVNDELDEMGQAQAAPKTRTIIWDLADLENPRLAKLHMGEVESSDHNLYIKGNLMYQANYRSGLRILDISDPENPKEVAYLDTAPYMGTGSGFNGAWSVYPFFDSGTIIVSSIEQGLFLVKHRRVIF